MQQNYDDTSEGADSIRYTVSSDSAEADSIKSKSSGTAGADISVLFCRIYNDLSLFSDDKKTG